jgi:hypothetical protein
MPFTVEQFFGLFATYNQALWPAPILAYLAGSVALTALAFPSRLTTLTISWILAAMWFVNGAGYHLSFFAEINPLAKIFGAVFLFQALMLLAAPIAFPHFRFAIRRDARSHIALMLIVFAALIYPAWGWLAGHHYPAVPVFGLAPCPTTIFTIGILLLGTQKFARSLLVIPMVWSAVGGSAAILLNVPQDFGLIAAGLIALALGVLQFWNKRRRDYSSR